MRGAFWLCGMKTVWSTAFAAVLIVFVGAGLGLGVNALRADGLALDGRGVTGAGSPGEPTGTCTANASTARAPEISQAEARALHGQERVTFVDARSAADYRAGHVQGALSLPYDVAAQAAGKSSLPVPPDHRIVVYCDYFDCQLSEQLAQLLSQSGCERVRVLQGGFPAWRDGKLPVTIGAAR
jgi:rhodanese-related sulfurtransferase